MFVRVCTGSWFQALVPAAANAWMPNMQMCRLQYIGSRSCRNKMCKRCILSAFPRKLINLTLWRPLLPYGYSYKASCARPGSAVICSFWHLGTLTFRTERQSARMSITTNDGWTLSGTGCFIAVPIWQHWPSKGWTAFVFSTKLTRCLS